MPSFTFFELHTPDVDRAREFYGAMFGWKFEPIPVPGPRFLLCESDGHHGAIQEDARTWWLNYVTVEDCVAAAKKAQELGGRILGEKVTVPSGSFVVVSDPVGAAMALWQPNA